MAAKKKLQIKDLAGRKLSKQQSSKVKGGKPKVICLQGPAAKGIMR